MNQDEELQRKIEGGHEPAGNPADVNAYREVFLRLNQRPALPQADNFAEKIIVKVLEKKRRRAIRDYAWFGIGITFLIAAFAVSIIATGFKVELGFLAGIYPYAGVFIFGLLFILLLNRLDKKLVTGKKD